MAKIDIIIVTYNAQAKLNNCLESLRKYTPNFNYRLTLVNNNNTDNTAEYLKKYNGQINIIDKKRNLGFSKAANIAIKSTSSKYIVLLDDDVELTRDWLIKLYGQIKGNSEVGIVGGKTVFPNNRILAADLRLGSLLLVGFGEIDKGQRDYVKACDALIGTCWLMRRELVDKVGYFDERFFPCKHEDVDYCIRTRLAGYKIIYTGQTKIIHHHLCRHGNIEQNRRNTQRFLKKWGKQLNKFPLKNSHPADKHIAAGITYLRKKSFKQAFDEFRRAELIDKRFSEPVFMGIALEGIGQHKKAIYQFKKVFDLNPTGHLMHYYLACIYKRLGLVKEAKEKSTELFNLIFSQDKELLKCL